MLLKSFMAPWSSSEIKAYIDEYNILVLFEEDWANREAIITIHGQISKNKKEELRERIIGMFGGRNMTDQLCDKINEYAEKWFNKTILNRKARVVNSRRKRK